MIITSHQYNRSTGLGNKLFPWARSLVYSYINKGINLPNIWISPRFGGLLRGGINSKDFLYKIVLLNNLSTKINITDLNNFRKYFLMDKKIISDINYPAIDNFAYTFSWKDNHQFSDLNLHRKYILNELAKISKNRINDIKEEYICINYRSGSDFTDNSEDKTKYLKTKISWYIQAIKLIRKNYGKLPVKIVSDGGFNHIYELKKCIPSSSYIYNRYAIQDLNILINSKIILGAGNSSFTAWGAFLSGAHFFSSEETPVEKWNIKSKPEQIVTSI